MKALLIDHDDSFTSNLQHWLKPLCNEIEVLNHRDLKPNSHANLIVLSPGPKSPQDYPHVLNFLQNVSPRAAVYGVCLGLQMLVHSNGGIIEAYAPPLHGKKSKLNILNSQYASLQNCEVARYHSLYCAQYNENYFETLAHSAEDHIPMWLKHKTKKWMGVQFHPESFMTEKAELHLKNLQDWVQS